jgi:tol-pal system protein YbgF
MTTDDTVSQPMPTDINGKVARLEQQVGYLQQLNLPAKLSQLQQAIANLRGLIDVQSQQLKQLEDQQRSLYADLNQRLTSLSKSAGMPAKATPTTTTDSVIAKPSTSGATTSAEETKAYHDAFTLITNKKYMAAISSLNDYLRKYPSGQFAPNAHYWLGELYIIAGDNDNAITQFNLVVNNYGDSCKAADALLKLAEIAFNNTRFDQAKEYWQTIVKKYPNCSAARVASVQLQKLQKSGAVG